MCGIFALIFLSKNGNKDTFLLHFELGMDMLKKRGPEKRSEIRTDRYLLGFQRLSINDLSENGDQPIRSNDGSVILMCNGEIFNYKDLVQKYDLVMKSESDCEVILRLYEKGVLNVSEINGDFAFLIVDDNKKTVMLSRDRVGVRPLFYGYTEDGSMVVASEMKCMSLCKSIFHVPPSSVIVINEKLEANCEYYYDLTLSLSQFYKDTDLKTLLIESTRKRLLSERPIGCLLSGGLDSSVICAILCSLVGPKNVRTYSIGMEGSLDLKYAKKVAEFLGTTHTEVFFTPEEGLKAIPEVIYNLESYDITTVRASVGMYLLGKVHQSEHNRQSDLFRRGF